MKRTLALLLSCALGFGLLAGCSGKSDPTYGPGDSSFTPPPLEYDGYSHVLYPVASSPKVEGALAAFGLELLKQARADTVEDIAERGIDSTPFIFVSPLSVALALSMAANGAEGETLTQFLEVLGGGADLEELNAAWAQLLLDYRAPGGSTRFNIANSLWKDLNGGITPDFIGICRGGYGAQWTSTTPAGRTAIRTIYSTSTQSCPTSRAREPRGWSCPTTTAGWPSSPSCPTCTPTATTTLGSGCTV